MNILHLDSSINGENSASRALSATIMAELSAANPAATVTYRDLVADPLDHLTLPGFATEASQQVMAEFQAADVIVIGAGMYNLSVPSQLKAWFDRIMIAGQTFRYTENGPVGLAGDKHAIIALARGGYYGEGSPGRAIEHAERYIGDVLGFIGIAHPRFVVAEGLAISPEARDAAMRIAQAEALELAAPLAA